MQKGSSIRSEMIVYWSSNSSNAHQETCPIDLDLFWGTFQMSS